MRSQTARKPKLKQKKTVKRIRWVHILLYAIAAIFLVAGIFLLTNKPQEAIIIEESSNINPKNALISFTFDDGFKDTYTKAAPVLAKHRLNGVVYVSTGCIDGIKACRDHVGGSKKFMSWDEVRELQNTYKWEIGSHSVNHPLLSQLDSAKKEYELRESKKILEQNGLQVTNFATPHGDYDQETLGLVAKYYTSHRAFRDQRSNIWPFNNAILQVKQVQGTISVDEVKRAIDEAVAKKQWLILVFHEINDFPSKNNEAYEYATADLDAIAAYVKEQQDMKRIQNVTVRNALANIDENMLPNGTFEETTPKGWLADDQRNIVRENSKGNYPTQNNSIRFTASGKTLHLQSPALNVVRNSTFMVKVYVDARDKKSGDFGFYVDEYDINGKWIAIKWLGTVNGKTVTYFSSPYKPTNPRVSSVRVQAYFGENPAGTVYIDDFAFYKLTNSK